MASAAFAVCAWMSQFAELTACHNPLRSGLPFNRGMPAVRACPSTDGARDQRECRGGHARHHRNLQDRQPAHIHLEARLRESASAWQGRIICLAAHRCRETWPARARNRGRRVAVVVADAPRCVISTSENTSRKSVVTARSRPSKRCSTRQARPLAVDLAALDAAADHEHGVAMPVIGAAAAVLRHCPAELRHGQDDGVGHSIAKVLGESGDAA